MIDRNLFVANKRRPLHFRLSDPVRQLVRVVIHLEIHRNARHRERWAAQLQHPATEEPGVERWLKRQLQDADLTHHVLRELFRRIEKQTWLDTDIEAAMALVGATDAQPETPNETGGGE